MENGNNISVITICFNNLPELKLTMQHVDSQTVAPFEHLIIDGSTNSGIKDFLEKTPQPAYRRWICERDNGISDAFNKGILNARGDIFHLHNSGDYYYDNTILETVTKHFSGGAYMGWLHGKYAQFRGGMWVITGAPFEREKLYRGMRTIGHPTMFVRREMYDKYGLFSTEKKIAMDYDFLVRIADAPFVFVDKPFVYFTPGGVSNRKVQGAINEMVASYEKRFGFSLKARLWGLRIRLIDEITQTGLGKMIFKLKNRQKQIEMQNIDKK